MACRLRRKPRQQQQPSALGMFVAHTYECYNCYMEADGWLQRMQWTLPRLGSGNEESVKT